MTLSSWCSLEGFCYHDYNRSIFLVCIPEDLSYFDSNWQEFILNSDWPGFVTIFILIWGIMLALFWLQDVVTWSFRWFWQGGLCFLDLFDRSNVILIMELFSNRHEFVLKTGNARLCYFDFLISQLSVTLIKMEGFLPWFSLAGVRFQFWSAGFCYLYCKIREGFRFFFWLAEIYVTMFFYLWTGFCFLGAVTFEQLERDHEIQVRAYLREMIS